MAYISSERVSEIRSEIKKSFPGYKFSITMENYSGVRIVIIEAPVALTEKKYEDVNIYSLGRYDYAQGVKKDILTKIVAIANEGVSYTETGDYGNQPSHYVYITIGEWNRPFKMVVNNSKNKPLIGIKLKAAKAA